MGTPLCPAALVSRGRARLRQPMGNGSRVYHLDYMYHSNSMGEPHLAATSKSGTLYFMSNSLLTGWLPATFAIIYCLLIIRKLMSNCACAFHHFAVSTERSSNNGGVYTSSLPCLGGRRSWYHLWRWRILSFCHHLLESSYSKLSNFEAGKWNCWLM